MYTLEILQFGDYHLELLPALSQLVVEQVTSRSIQLRIYTNPDTAGWIQYTRQMYPDITYTICNNDLSTNSPKIFLTAAEANAINVEIPNAVRIAHVPEDITASPCITLSPYVSREYILPVYRTPSIEKKQSDSLTLAVIGVSTSQNKSFQDMAIMLEKFPMLRIAFFTRMLTADIALLSASYPQRVFLELNNSAAELIQKTKALCDGFLLLPSESSYHLRDRLSGMIPLSISSGIPLISVNEIKRNYEMESCVLFESIIEAKRDLGDIIYDHQSLIKQDFLRIKRHNNNRIKRFLTTELAGC